VTEAGKFTADDGKVLNLMRSPGFSKPVVLGQQTGRLASQTRCIALAAEDAR